MTRDYIPVTIIIPTYRRPEKLRRCLASIERQTYSNISVLEREDTNREFAIGIWNRLMPIVISGVGVYLCDDVELDPGCIAAAVELLVSRFPDLDGVVGFHQRNLVEGGVGTSKSAMGMIGCSFLHRFPKRMPFCPDYSRFHFDSELGLVARELGRFLYTSKAAIDHYHPGHYKEEMDETHDIVREPAEVAMDRKVWDRRRTLGLRWGIDNRLVGRDL